MRFLKTLQKKDSEKPFKSEDPDSFVGPDDDVQHSDNVPPGLLSISDLRIGTPKIDFDTRHSGNLNRPDVRDADATSLNGHSQTTSGLLAVQKRTLYVETVNPRVVSVTQPQSAYCEEYRKLRTRILHKGQNRKLQAIVIVSVDPSEGKSITALNLSLLFAQTDGVKALIIDSDLRMPSCASYLGIESGKGLSEMLVGKASLMESMIQLEPSGLYLLPGGKARSDVAELISGPRFAEILDEARGFFDYVIIDAPPLGIFTDAAVLIDLADGALLVVGANQTRYKDIDRILDTLPRERFLGTVLNQSEDTLIGESY